MNITVLIIDDSESDRYIIKRAINQSYKDVTYLEAGVAAEGLTFLESEQTIDFIFLDYLLPDMDGVAVLKEIYNEQTGLGPCPIIMMTGQGRRAVTIEAIRYGAQDYITKHNASFDTIHIEMIKAQEFYNLKRQNNESRALLEHAQKMDAVGQLTGGIAHDFNNLLAIIFGNTRLVTDLIKRGETDKELIIEKIDKIQKTAERGASLVKHLMVFSRQKTLEPITLNMNSLITDLKSLLGRTLGDFIKVETDLADDIFFIDADPSQMENIIINMSVNARDAMLNGGTLKIKTNNVILDHIKAHALGIEPGEYVRLCITDNGVGIPEDIIEKIFDPFFTTKEIGKGTGIGLSTVYGFVKESDGALEVESARKEGTTFHLYFPRSCENHIHQDAPDDEPSITENTERRTETILIVEDEEDMRAITTLMLEEKGYKILQATNGSEALDIIKEQSNIIDLVFTDIAMPGDINGVQMAARAQVIKPDIKLVFTTGYAKDAAPDMNLINEYKILHKPYPPEALIKTVSDVLKTKKVI